MSGLKTKSAISAVAIVVAGLVSSGQAAVTASFDSAYTPGTSIFPTPPAPTIVTTNNSNTNTTAANAGGGSLYTSFAGAAAGGGVGQTFTVDATTTGKLDKLVFVAEADGGATQNVTLNLFAVTGTTVGTDDGKGTSQGATISATNLLGGGTGLAFNGLGTAFGFITLDLTSTDEVILAPGTYYAELFNNMGNANSINIARQGGTNTAYDNGNAYSRGSAASTSIGTVFGGATRDAALAVYTVPTPEPGSVALLALGGIGLIRRRRA